MPQASSDTPTSSSIVEALQAWFRTCPRLTSGAKVGVDWLPDEPLEYAIYATPTTIRTRENVLGEEVPLDIQTQNFIFASKDVHYFRFFRSAELQYALLVKNEF